MPRHISMMPRHSGGTLMRYDPPVTRDENAEWAAFYDVLDNTPVEDIVDVHPFVEDDPSWEHKPIINETFIEHPGSADVPPIDLTPKYDDTPLTPRVDVTPADEYSEERRQWEEMRRERQARDQLREIQFAEAAAERSDVAYPLNTNLDSMLLPVAVGLFVVYGLFHAGGSR